MKKKKNTSPWGGITPKKRDRLFKTKDFAQPKNAPPPSRAENTMRRRYNLPHPHMCNFVNLMLSVLLMGKLWRQRRILAVVMDRAPRGALCISW
jgi:hypothetical protein